jgi:hypothetical protein
MNRAARFVILIIAVVTLSGLVALCPKVGHASLDDLIALDLVPNSCDRHITLDTISNREWLDVPESEGFSHNQRGLAGPKNSSKSR